MSTAEIAVSFQHVSKVYNAGNFALNDVCLDIPRGKLVTFIGPSGCGKTTSLKMINRLIDPTTGSILVEGSDVSKINSVELRRHIGYVIQQIGLFPHMTIEANISIVPSLIGQSKIRQRRRAEELLDLIGLDPAKFRHRYPRELSGGQQQRIGVARALAADPSIILMDEPFSALDPISREQLQNELVTLQSAVAKTIVFVTHDMDEALRISDWIVLMRDGVIVQQATPDQLLRHPKDEFVRGFIGEKRFVQAAWNATAADLMIDAVTVRPSQGLAEAINVMKRSRVNGLVVTNRDGLYVGVVGPQEIFARYGDEHTRIEDAMRRDGPFVTSDTDVQEVVSLMESDARGFLPVCDQRLRLLGVITRSSLIQVLIPMSDKEGVEEHGTLANAVAELE